MSCHGCITIDQAGSGNIEVRTRSVAGNGTTSLVVNNNTVTNWGVSTNYVSYYYGSGSFNSVQICRLNGGSDILVDYVKFNNVTYLAEEYPNDCAE